MLSPFRSTRIRKTKMSTLDQYDPFLIEVAKMLDPGRWWSDGPVGYVASMYEPRSFEDRANAAVQNAERLLRHLAGAISGNAALPDFFEGSINDRITQALFDVHQKSLEVLNAKEAEITALKQQIEEAALDKSDAASSFIELAGDVDIFQDVESVHDNFNPLMADLARGVSLEQKRDVALVDIGPEPAPASGFGENKQASSAPMSTLITALRRAQYAAEPMSIEINASIRLHPTENKDESIATIDLTVQNDRVTRETIWLDPDRPTDKYEQVFAIVQSGAKDAGRHFTKLNR